MRAPWYQTENHPHYVNPPVVETAMALEFGPIPGLDLFRLVQLQGRWADEYPAVKDVPGAPPTPFQDAPQEMFFFGEPPKRVWASAPDNGMLVQTQSDRLVLNWRKPESVGPYPGYAATLPEFFRLWEKLEDFLRESNLPAPIPTMGEFTYVNVVDLADGESPADVIAMLNEPESLPGNETQAKFQFVRSIERSSTEPFAAQVHVVGETKPRPGASAQLMFTVIARVLLSSEIDRPEAALNAAHGLATYTFSKIVSDSKQEPWTRVPS